MRTKLIVVVLYHPSIDNPGESLSRRMISRTVRTITVEPSAYSRSRTHDVLLISAALLVGLGAMRLSLSDQGHGPDWAEDGMQRPQQFLFFFFW